MSEPHIIAEIIPLSLGAAINPTNLTIILLYLGAENRSLQKGTAYYTGNFIAAFIVCFLSLVFGAALISFIPHFSTTFSAYIDAGLGFILILLGIYLFRKKKPAKEVHEAKSEPSLYKMFSFGFLLNITNYSSIPLLFIASKDVGLAGLSFEYQIGLLLVICLIMNAMVEIPIIFYMLQPKKASKVLRRANIFFKANGNIIAGIWIAIIGLYLVWRGFNILHLLN